MPLLALLSACELPPTQLLVVIDSDYEPRELSRVHVHVTDPFIADELSPQATVDVTGEDALPLSFGVVPRDDVIGAEARIVLRGVGPDSSMEAISSARAGFVDGQTLLLPMFLWKDCAGFSSCGRDETCVGAAGMPVCMSNLRQNLEPVTPGTEIEAAATFRLTVRGIDLPATGTFHVHVETPDEGHAAVHGSTSTAQWLGILRSTGTYTVYAWFDGNRDERCVALPATEPTWLWHIEMPTGDVVLDADPASSDFAPEGCAPFPMKADVDESGCVDCTDLDTVAGYVAMADPRGDIDGSGTANASDQRVLRSYLGLGCEAGRPTCD